MAVIPSDTLLAEFVRRFGDETLVFLVENLYSSSVFKIILFTGAVAMMISTAISLHNRKLHDYVKIFWIAWFMAMPIGNKPAYYTFINSFSTLITVQLQKSTYDLFTHFGTGQSYPPGFVADTLIKASTTSITDPALSNAVDVLIDNCVPITTINENGYERYFNASDLFRVKLSSGTGGVFEGMSFSYPFSKEVLENRTFEYRGERESCLNFLEATLRGLYSNVNKQFFGMGRESLYVGAMNGEMSDKWISEWGDYSRLQTSNLSKAALNLATASSVQSNLLKKHFGVDLNISGDHFTDGANSPLIEMQKRLMGESDPTKISYNIMNLPNSVMRAFNIDDFGGAASDLVKLNDSLQKLPYYVSTIQVFLKVIFPLVIFTPFLMASWRIVSMWSVAYVLSLIIPWIMMISRSICNIILLHSLKIEETATTLSTDPSYLKFGLDFNAAVRMLDDTGKFLATYVETENALWKSLMVIVPVISWFASGPISKIGANMTNAIGSQFQGRMVNKGLDTTGTATKALAKVAMVKAPIVGKLMKK